MKVVRCAGAPRCGSRIDVAGEHPSSTWLSIAFLSLDYVSLTAAGWIFEADQWWCQHCTRRRRLVKGLPSLRNVTDPSPPTETKK